MTIYDEYGGSETYYYVKDASNTVHVLVDEDGLIVEYYYYDAFGNLKMRDVNYNLITESVYGNRFLFQGREYDYDTALYYFRARWYEPETGRWLSPDPIGISGGLNLYAFCGNDPINYVDPSGLAIVRNKTPWPIVVSGGLGMGKGHGNRKNYYAVIPPGGTGGGEYPLAVYETPAKAIAAYNSPSFIPPDSRDLLFDVDNYHDYACNLENASIPPVSTKIDGNDFGFIFDLIDQNGKIIPVLDRTSRLGTYYREGVLFLNEMFNKLKEIF